MLNILHDLVHEIYLFHHSKDMLQDDNMKWMFLLLLLSNEIHKMSLDDTHENEYFAMITFFITSLCLGGWIYYLHYIAKDPSKGLKEILYVVLFLTIFTTIWACLGIYMQSDFFIHNTD